MLESKRSALERRLAELFHVWDRLVEKTHDQPLKNEKEQTLKQMCEILSQRTYLNTMLDNIAEVVD